MDTQSASLSRSPTISVPHFEGPGTPSFSELPEVAMTQILDTHESSLATQATLSHVVQPERSLASVSQLQTERIQSADRCRRGTAEHRSLLNRGSHALTEESLHRHTCNPSGQNDRSVRTSAHQPSYKAFEYDEYTSEMASATVARDFAGCDDLSVDITREEVSALEMTTDCPVTERWRGLASAQLSDDYRLPETEWLMSPVTPDSSLSSSQSASSPSHLPMPNASMAIMAHRDSSTRPPIGTEEALRTALQAIAQAELALRTSRKALLRAMTSIVTRGSCADNLPERRSVASPDSEDIEIQQPRAPDRCDHAKEPTAQADSRSSLPCAAHEKSVSVKPSRDSISSHSETASTHTHPGKPPLRDVPSNAIDGGLSQRRDVALSIPLPSPKFGVPWLTGSPSAHFGLSHWSETPSQQHENDSAAMDSEETSTASPGEKVTHSAINGSPQLQAALSDFNDESVIPAQLIDQSGQYLHLTPADKVRLVRIQFPALLTAEATEDTSWSPRSGLVSAQPSLERISEELEQDYFSNGQSPATSLVGHGPHTLCQDRCLPHQGAESGSHVDEMLCGAHFASRASSTPQQPRGTQILPEAFGIPRALTAFTPTTPAATRVLDDLIESEVSPPRQPLQTATTTYGETTSHISGDPQPPELHPTVMRTFAGGDGQTVSPMGIAIKTERDGQCAVESTSKAVLQQNAAGSLLGQAPVLEATMSHIPRNLKEMRRQAVTGSKRLSALVDESDGFFAPFASPSKADLQGANLTLHEEENCDCSFDSTVHEADCVLSRKNEPLEQIPLRPPRPSLTIDIPSANNMNGILGSLPIEPTDSAAHSEGQLPLEREDSPDPTDTHCSPTDTGILASPSQLSQKTTGWFSRRLVKSTLVRAARKRSRASDATCRHRESAPSPSSSRDTSFESTRSMPQRLRPPSIAKSIAGSGLHDRTLPLKGVAGSLRRLTSRHKRYKYSTASLSDIERNSAWHSDPSSEELTIGTQTRRPTVTDDEKEEEEIEAIEELLPPLSLPRLSFEEDDSSDLSMQSSDFRKILRHVSSASSIRKRDDLATESRRLRGSFLDAVGVCDVLDPTTSERPTAAGFRDKAQKRPSGPPAVDATAADDLTTLETTQKDPHASNPSVKERSDEFCIRSNDQRASQLFSLPPVMQQVENRPVVGEHQMHDLQSNSDRSLPPSLRVDGGRSFTQTGSHEHACENCGLPQDPSVLSEVSLLAGESLLRSAKAPRSFHFHSGQNVETASGNRPHGTTSPNSCPGTPLMTAPMKGEQASGKGSITFSTPSTPTRSFALSESFKPNSRGTDAEPSERLPSTPRKDVVHPGSTGVFKKLQLPNTNTRGVVKPKSGPPSAKGLFQSLTKIGSSADSEAHRSLTASQPPSTLLSSSGKPQQASLPPLAFVPVEQDSILQDVVQASGLDGGHTLHRISPGESSSMPMATPRSPSPRGLRKASGGPAASSSSFENPKAMAGSTMRSFSGGTGPGITPPTPAAARTMITSTSSNSLSGRANIAQSHNVHQGR